MFYYYYLFIFIEIVYLQSNEKETHNLAIK